jgi:hypothetical protein
MNIKIDKTVIQRTSNCKCEFSCLSGDKTCLCEAKCSIGSEVLEVTPKSGIDCNYCVSVGNTTFCHCPTRNEIFNRYNK